ncbi:MAG: alpha-amylase family glycosyl hydrolase, partial [Bacteroidota bacterium]
LMQKVVLLLAALWAVGGLRAQLIITDPAAPTDDQAVTITFDATQGTAGLANCNCDVYLHTGVITNNSTSASDWKYVATEWGVANAAWRLTPVDGEANKYTYTYSPSIREYFGVPDNEEIQQIAFVFRNADGSLEGKATGGADIFVDVTQGGVLGMTLAGDPGVDTWPLGRPLPILAGTTVEATIQVFDNGMLITETTGTELDTDLVFTTSGSHTIEVVATVGDQEVREGFVINAELTVTFTDPADGLIFADAGNTINLTGTSYLEADLVLTANGTEIATATSSNFNESYTIPEGSVSSVVVSATFNGETATDELTIITGDPEVAEAPANVRPGATDTDNGGVQLILRAPGKNDVFVVGNFNNWSPTAASRMKKTGDGQTFHLVLNNLPEGEDLLYQYLIDGNIQQPDPYSTLLLDANDDPFIGDEVFTDLPDYPSAADGLVSWHQRARPEFPWQHTDYDRPDPKKMVIYELLVRDFLADHSYKSLTDTLDYLDRLGVNAIELMPVAEFEGNISWGYNVSYHMALDKYYGSPEDLKTFIDACHARGIAVIIDVVYNHAFSESSLCRMWWDQAAFRPTADNPYLNVTARHPFNVGYDFNHESALTKEYVKVTTQYWLEEFQVDGFRWDLSKGFTQNFSNDVGQWNQYDASRIAIIKDYADHVWNVDNQAMMIMEHLGQQSEERELADYGNGMYFWSGFNPHDEFLEASMGYPSNLREVIAENRGFVDKNLVAYMESHDEERMQYKNEQFGNSSGSYNTRNEATGLDRVMLASTFFYTVPGPKMLWQFGELGYGFSINWCNNGSTNDGCRTDPKPIRWDYREDGDRQDIYNWVADLNYLRNNYDFFHGDITRERLNNPGKVLHLSGTDGMVSVSGNFGVTSERLVGIFPSAGTWYDYATGESIEITDPAAGIDYEPGEYHVYLDQPISRNGDNNIGTSTNAREVARLKLSVQPNPTAGNTQINFQLDGRQQVRVELLDVSGRLQRVLFAGVPIAIGTGAMQVDAAVGDLPAGVYFVRVTDGVGSGVQRLVVR